MYKKLSEDWICYQAAVEVQHYHGENVILTGDMFYK